jgi:DNA-binding response OmpR family regulator
MIITSRDTKKESGIAMMSGAHEVIQKPFAIMELRSRVSAILAATP